MILYEEHFRKVDDFEEGGVDLEMKKFDLTGTMWHLQIQVDS